VSDRGADDGRGKSGGAEEGSHGHPLVHGRAGLSSASAAGAGTSVALGIVRA
jgi:hypothetical protein